MALGKFIKEVVESPELMEAFYHVRKKRRGIVSEFDKPIRPTGFTSHCMIPKEFLDDRFYAHIQIIDRTKIKNNEEAPPC